ncbi:hypothetical protein BN9982_40032 [Mycobacterium tuberculosis]|nr:hypothetical protein BN9982_40032 [Mycobacterium tuberculosis]
MTAAIETDLAGVPLDLVGGTHDCFARVTTGLAQCPSLSEQVPALVEFDLDAAQLLLLLGLADATVPQLRSQRLLLGHQVTDVCQGLAVCRFASLAHGSSVPDLTRCPGTDSVGCISPAARTRRVRRPEGVA